MSEELNRACRMRYWEEMDANERIALMAEMLEYLKNIVDRQGETIQRLENHVHAHGRIFYGEGAVTPLVWPNNNILRRGPKP